MRSRRVLAQQRLVQRAVAERVLVLEFVSTVCAFAVLEGPERLVEWGSRGITRDVSRFLPTLAREVLRYRPDVIVVEDAAHTRKGARVQEHLVWVEQWASDNGHPWRSVGRAALRSWNAHLGPNKDTRANALAKLFPELRTLVPRPRKIWQAEAKRLSIFVAIERGLCYYDGLYDNGLKADRENQA